jgi:hypothetical protein
MTDDRMADEPETGTTAATAHDLQAEARTANAIYGVIVGAGVMAAAHGEAVGRLAVAVLVTLLVYWAAERYAHVFARRIALGRGLTGAERRLELSHGWELVTASFLPLLVLLGSSIIGAGLTVSVFAALICSTALLCISGWQVGREAHMNTAQRLISAALAGAFGLAMIALKALLH